MRFSARSLPRRGCPPLFRGAGANILRGVAGGWCAVGLRTTAAAAHVGERPTREGAAKRLQLGRDSNALLRAA